MSLKADICAGLVSLESKKAGAGMGLMGEV